MVGLALFEPGGARVDERRREQWDSRGGWQGWGCDPSLLTTFPPHLSLAETDAISDVASVRMPDARQ